MNNIVNFSKHKVLNKLGKRIKSNANFHVAEDHPPYEDDKETKQINEALEKKESKEKKASIPKFAITDDKSLYAYYQLTKANTPNNVLDRATRLKGATIVNQIKTIKNQQVQKTTDIAAKIERKRTAILLNDQFSEQPQRFVNCLSLATYVRPHKHTLTDQWELMCHLTGKFAVLFFDESGILLHRLEMSDEQTKIVEIPPHIYHSFIALTPCSYLEIRNCIYEPKIDRVYADWAPPENSAETAKFLEELHNAKIGDFIAVKENDY